MPKSCAAATRRHWAFTLARTDFVPAFELFAIAKPTVSARTNWIIRIAFSNIIYEVNPSSRSYRINNVTHSHQAARRVSSSCRTLCASFQSLARLTCALPDRYRWAGAGRMGAVRHGPNDSSDDRSDDRRNCPADPRVFTVAKILRPWWCLPHGGPPTVDWHL